MELPPALETIYSDEHPYIVVQKSAQVGVSEYLINCALWCADTFQGRNGVAFYVMPTQTHCDDFSQARIDRAIAQSPYLQARTQPTPPFKKGLDRMRLKKVGDGYVYLRGADNRRQLSTADADLVVLDEFDFMQEGVLEAARRRLLSSPLAWLRVGSTPRHPEAGINALFLRSDQHYYFLPCPSCGYKQRLTWEENVDRERAAVICWRCHESLDLLARGEWVPAKPGNEIRGYHLSRLYFPAGLKRMIEASQAGTPSEQQEFQNSDLGEVFVPPGGRISWADLDACRRDYPWGTATGGVVCVGVDVGLKLHVVVREKVDKENSKAIFIGEVDDFDSLDVLVRRFGVRQGVIDAQPEYSSARRFVQDHHGFMLAYYDRHTGDHERAREDSTWVLHVNRTLALERLFDALHQGRLWVPSHARELGGKVRDGVGEFYREMTALNRVLEKNAVGNWVARYVDNDRPDHYAHAEAYCWLAAFGFPERTFLKI